MSGGEAAAAGEVAVAACVGCGDAGRGGETGGEAAGGEGRPTTLGDGSGDEEEAPRGDGRRGVGSFCGSGGG